MFEKSNLFALMNSESRKQDFEIARISLDENTRKNITKLFSEQTEQLVNSPDGSLKEIRDFCPGFITDLEDEINRIEDFEMPQQITKALDDPAALQIYEPLDDHLPLIRALFVGEVSRDSVHIAFQRFKKAQYLRASSIRLLFDKDTMTGDHTHKWQQSQHRVGLCVLPVVDAYFNTGSLLFSSFYYASQILDLNEYSKPVTQPQIDNFLASSLLDIGDSQYTLESFNSWELRRISSIYDYNVLENCTLKDLKKAAKKIGIDLPTENDRLVFPKDRKGRKQILSFLNEDIFSGLLTSSAFESNSKRPL